MTIRPGSLSLVIVALTVFGTPVFSYAQTAPKRVTVYIDTVMAADAYILSYRLPAH